MADSEIKNRVEISSQKHRDDKMAAEPEEPTKTLVSYFSRPFKPNGNLIWSLLAFYLQAAIPERLIYIHGFIFRYPIPVVLSNYFSLFLSYTHVHTMS